MRKRYDQYCPVSHALCLVGERWSLLVVLELMHGPKRYTDLTSRLPGIGTNIATRRATAVTIAAITPARIPRYQAVKAPTINAGNMLQL